jgi:Fe-S-cluster containining protein
LSLPLPQLDWFANPDPETGERGLRFQCTLCGNCCSGPEGYVLVDDAEAAALAARLNLPLPEFLERFTRPTSAGRSLTEKLSHHGNDCVFLDRESAPGRALCSVYEIRPRQCRTWPFWKSLLVSRKKWDQASRVCPGIGTGPLFSPEEIRRRQAVIDI